MWGLRPHAPQRPRQSLAPSRCAAYPCDAPRRSCGAAAGPPWGRSPPSTRAVGCPGHQVRPRSCGAAAGRVLLRGGVGAQSPIDNTRSASGPRGRCQPAGGVGAQPPQKETPRAGGWARAARSACSSAMGAWGAQPPIDDTRSASGPRLRCQPGGGVGAQPPQNETPRAGGRARAARSACSSAMGAWGAQPPIDDTRSASGRLRDPSRCQPARRARPRWRGGAAPTHALALGAAVALPTPKLRGRAGGESRAQRALSALRSDDDEGLGGALGGAEERRGDQAEEEHGEGGEAE